jgi:uncharacterized protein YajQ (UPF0234 family)
VRDVLIGKLAKRKVDVRFLEDGDIKKIGGDKVARSSRSRTASSPTTPRKSCASSRTAR